MSQNALILLIACALSTSCTTKESDPISAQTQVENDDVVTAPKVTTKSGNEAIIRIVEVHRYPQSEINQTVGPLVFDEVDRGHLWIYVKGRNSGYSIQLDGIYNPHGFLGYTDATGVSKSVQEDINDTIYSFVNQQLFGSSNLWLMITNDGYSGIGQVGGILLIDTKQQQTLQELLIKEGYARVDLGRKIYRSSIQIPSNYLTKWGKLEAIAKKNTRGFWKSHPQIMKRWWDQN